MPDNPEKKVAIAVTGEGAFEDVTLADSVLADIVKPGIESWTQPILLSGSDVAAEIAAFLRQRGRSEWLAVRDFRDIAGKRRNEFYEMEGRLDPRFYENLSGRARARLAEILRIEAHFSDIVEFIAKGPSGEGYLGRTYVGEDFANHVERLCNTTGLILPWTMRNSILPAFVLAVWSRRPRLMPLVLHAPKRFGVPTGAGIEVQSAGIGFGALADEVQRVFGMSTGDVEKAYRVWQLSKASDTTKPQATTPAAVSQDIAREFLGVLARARTDRQIAAAVGQKPAPLIFELDPAGIGLRQGVATADPKAVVAAGAQSLRRRIERLLEDPSFLNAVPSARDILSLAIEILGKIGRDEHTDADVVELGLELNALQWHVDAVRGQLGEVSVGELTGLFANQNLFLGRFPIWLEYTGSSASTGRQEDGVAAFEVALQLLRGAQQRPAFLTDEANKRIGAVLERSAEDPSAPPLREGLVRSGENLAAVTAEGLSRVVVKQAKDLGAKVKEKGYEEASSAIVSFAKRHGPDLIQLGRIRDWPWLGWLQQLLS